MCFRFVRMPSGRKKIEIKKIENIKSRRVAFSKRRNGLFRKAAQLSRLTGCRVAALAFSSDVMTPFLYGDLALLEDAAAAVCGNSNGLVKFKPLLSGGADLEIESRSSACGGVEENCLGRGGNKDLCFVAELNSNGVKLNPLPGADFGIGGCTGNCGSAGCDLGKYLEHGQGSDDKDSCSVAEVNSGRKLNPLPGADFGIGECVNYGRAEGDLGNYLGHGQGRDDKYFFFTDDGIAKLIALGGSNAGCSSDMMVSSNDLGNNFGHSDNKNLSITDEELAQLFGFRSADASCCNYERVGDDTDLIFTEGEFAQLMECDRDEEPVAVGAENVTCSLDGASSAEKATMMLHCRTKYNDDTALKMIPCSSSSATCEHFCFEDPSATAYTNTGRKSDSDEGLFGSCEELWMKQRMEAFGEAMREQLRIACEAGEMTSDEFHWLY